MIYVILGQTASGKTSLALSLAKKLHLPIISADAFQCYKMMDIGTDKPKKSDISDIEYYFYDEYYPDEEVSVYNFQKKYRPILENYVKNNQDVLIVGGTFLYIKALLFNYQFKENDTRTSIYRDLSLKELQDILKEKDAELYEMIDNKNSRRVIRALEQIDEGISRKDVLEANDNKPLYPTVFFQISIDKDKGNELIDNRIDKMFADGLINEVKDLMSKYSSDLKAFQAVGYKEVISGLKNGYNIDQIKDKIKIHTHQYAKKQRTFLRNQFNDVIIKTKQEIHDIISYNHLFKQRTLSLLKPGMLQKIEGSKLLLAGVGGVGASVLNALVRTSFLNITIIDYDTVNESNLNRQTFYDLKDLNQSKVDVCKYKSLNLNPLCKIVGFSKMITCEHDLPSDKFDYIIDCVDSVEAKVALYLKAKKDGSRFISSQGLGFQYDSTKVKYGKLEYAFDPLAKRFKEALKKSAIIDEDIADIAAVYSQVGRLKGPKNNKTIGSLVTATNAGGNAIVSWILKELYEEYQNENQKNC